MNTIDFIRVFLPSFVLYHFDAVKITDNYTRIDIYLDEKSILPSDLLSRPVISYVFTSAT